MPGVCAVGEKIFVLHRVYTKILDSKFFIFPKNTVRGRCEKRLGKNCEGKAVFAVSPADNGAPVFQVGSEKHDVAVIVLNDAGIMDCCDRIGYIVLCEDGILGVSFKDVCVCSHRLSGNNNINIYNYLYTKTS